LNSAIERVHDRDSTISVCGDSGGKGKHAGHRSRAADMHEKRTVRVVDRNGVEVGVGNPKSTGAVVSEALDPRHLSRRVAQFAECETKGAGCRVDALDPEVERIADPDRLASESDRSREVEFSGPISPSAPGEKLPLGLLRTRSGLGVEVEGNDSMPSGLDDEDPALGARDSAIPVGRSRSNAITSVVRRSSSSATTRPASESATTIRPPQTATPIGLKNSPAGERAIRFRRSTRRIRCDPGSVTTSASPCQATP
jgi:hypothetical protein